MTRSHFVECTLGGGGEDQSRTLWVSFEEVGSGRLQGERFFSIISDASGRSVNRIRDPREEGRDAYAYDSAACTELKDVEILPLKGLFKYWQFWKGVRLVRRRESSEV